MPASDLISDPLLEKAPTHEGYKGDRVEVPDLPSVMRFSVPREMGLDRTLAEVEIEHICNVLASVDGNKTQAAEILGIDRKTLREKLKGLGTPPA